MYHTRPIVEAERKPVEGKMAQEEEVERHSWTGRLGEC